MPGNVFYPLLDQYLNRQVDYRETPTKYSFTIPLAAELVVAGGFSSSDEAAWASSASIGPVDLMGRRMAKADRYVNYQPQRNWGQVAYLSWEL